MFMFVRYTCNYHTTTPPHLPFMPVLGGRARQQPPHRLRSCLVCGVALLPTVSEPRNLRGLFRRGLYVHDDHGAPLSERQ